jgi:hypothetical protein
MNEKECKAFQQWLVDKLSPFALPILLAPDISLEPGEIVNGSGCLIEHQKNAALVRAKAPQDVQGSTSGHRGGAKGSVGEDVWQ